MFESIELPIVDVTPLLHHVSANQSHANASSEARAASASMLHALSTVGAFQCRITEGNFTDEDVFNTCDALFDIEASEKKACIEKRGGFVRGFLGMGDESGGVALEVKEAFSYGTTCKKNVESCNKLQGQNAFPPSLSKTHVDKLLSYHEICSKVSRAITRGMALALEGNKTLEECVSLTKDAENAASISLMRLFRYYPYSTADKSTTTPAIPHVNRIGSSPHTDWGFLTLIRSTRSGLQVASTSTVTDNTTWKTVVPVSNCFTVNGGDYLSVITNGKVISPLHRVINAEEEVRTSLVFFYYPPYETTVPVDFEFRGSNSGDMDPIVLERIKNLSLFRDQTAVASESGKDNVPSLDLKQVSFGDYISSKWESVARNGGY
ncbi:UNVERIFIED_CONTAM: hypothetical protein HDU68_010693 [Siphonaria sp. JEL0065]|nr:hypothetical protein HDU68_010693 [Siphonaria sp. JEL0065]